MDDMEWRRVDGGEDVGVDADRVVDRPIDVGIGAVDPVADDDEVLVVLETSGSGSQRMPSVLMQ
jgi:hypothetical protein